MFESLESRRMLAASAVLRNGVLTVRATGQDDIASIANVTSKKIEVAIVTGTKTFAKFFKSGDVKQLKLILDNGKDQAYLTGLNKKVRVTVDAGAGDDLILGSNGPSTFIGGKGTDLITAGTAKNVFNIKDGQRDSVNGNKGDKVTKDPSDRVSLR